jgi:hypothetical protein
MSTMLAGAAHAPSDTVQILLESISEWLFSLQSYPTNFKVESMPGFQCQDIFSI